MDDEHPEWMAQAQCKGRTEEMFPATASGVPVARQICMGCGVFETCLEYALTNRIEYGVWAGTDWKERKRMMRERRRAS